MTYIKSFVMILILSIALPAQSTDKPYDPEFHYHYSMRNDGLSQGIVIEPSIYWSGNESTHSSSLDIDEVLRKAMRISFLLLIGSLAVWFILRLPGAVLAASGIYLAAAYGWGVLSVLVIICGFAVQIAVDNSLKAASEKK